MEAVPSTTLRRFQPLASMTLPFPVTRSPFCLNATSSRVPPASNSFWTSSVSTSDVLCPSTNSSSRQLINGPPAGDELDRVRLRDGQQLRDWAWHSVPGTGLKRGESVQAGSVYWFHPQQRV
jgi:hypothetical protein